MSLPPSVRPHFDLLLCTPLVDPVPLRQEVAAFAASIHEAVDRDELDLDMGRVDAVAQALEAMLKRVSRKTTPLHHRLIVATALFFIEGPDRGRPLDDARFRDDVAVLNETARVIRRPELSIRT